MRLRITSAVLGLAVLFAAGCIVKPDRDKEQQTGQGYHPVVPVCTSWGVGLVPTFV
jgi:hypothetical protein